MHKFVILTHFFNIFLVYTSLGCPFKNCIICPFWVDFNPDFKYLMFTFIKRDSFSFFLLSGYFICPFLLFSQLIFLRIYFMIGSLLKFSFQIISYDTQNNALIQTLLLFPFYKWGNWDLNAITDSRSNSKWEADSYSRSHS